MSSLSDSRISLVYNKPANFLTSKTGIGIVVGTLFIIAVLSLIIGLVIAGSNNYDSGDGRPSSSPRDTNPLERAKDILRRVPLVDGHNDFAWQIQMNFRGQMDKFDMNKDLRETLKYLPYYHPSQTDIPRLRQGLLGAQIWSAYSPCFNQFKDSVTKGLDQVDFIKRLVKTYSDTFQFVTTSEGIMQAHTAGKIASMIGLEGGHMIDDSLSVLRIYYEVGVRYMTLTWSCNTPWADGYPATRYQNPVHYGLTDWGKRVVKEMNRLGMIVDISHVSWDTMDDVFNVSSAPVIYSHSSSFAMCPHHRNAPDYLLQKLKKNGGTIMVNFHPNFINCTNETVYQEDYRTASLSQIADHLDHIKSVIGPDHIGIGSDFDGSDHIVYGMEDVSKYPYLFEELIKRGWSDSELEKLAYHNFHRVFQAVEKTRDKRINEEPDDTPFNYDDIPPDGRPCITTRWESDDPNADNSTSSPTISSTTVNSTV